MKSSTAQVELFPAIGSNDSSIETKHPARNVPADAVRWLVAGERGPDTEAWTEQLKAFGCEVEGPHYDAYSALRAAETTSIDAAVLLMDPKVDSDVTLALAKLLTQKMIPFVTYVGTGEVPAPFLLGGVVIPIQSLPFEAARDLIAWRFPERIINRMDLTAPLVPWFAPAPDNDGYEAEWRHPNEDED
jgi:hypothetical protein